MSEVVVTIKAGVGHDVPWIVFHGDSVYEVENMLNGAGKLYENAAYFSKLFANTFDTMPNSIAELLKRELGAEYVSSEPVQENNPTPPPTPAAPAADEPWKRTAAPVVQPWETAGGAPAAQKILVKLPYAEKNETEGSPYMLQRAFKNYFFQQRNKLTWVAARKGYEFTSHPTAELLQVARDGATSLGGSVEE